VVKPEALPAINTLVDIGNAVSLRHRLPAGVHSIATLPMAIELRPAADGDRFLPADGAELETVAPQEIVLARGLEVLTRRWTWRQSALTRTQPDTRTVFFNVDGLPPAEGRVEQAMRDIAEAVDRFCGGRLVASSMLTARQPSFACAPGQR
jgi:DNA/RNA-binding domain of Phe-tRNA-synthetase-like protein